MVTLGNNRQVASTDTVARPLEIQHLVVPLDGTPLAESALQPAASLARVLKAEITLVRAYGENSYLPSGSAMLRGRSPASDEVHHASLYMARLQADLRSHGIRVSSRVVQARAFEAILEIVAHTPAQLIVLPTRGGMRAGERSVAGSVTVDVIRNGEIPVLIVNGATGNPFAQHLADVLRLVLIENDLRRNATVREYVATIARAFSARVTVLRSLPQITRGPEHGSLVNTSADDPLAHLREQGIDVRVETRGDNANVDAHLGGFARWQRAHLVVVSGHHGVPRPYAEAEALLVVLRESRVPVLFVP